MAVVQSDGQLQSLHRGNTGPMAASAGMYGDASGSGLSMYGSYSDYASIYRTQPAVRTVISFLARNVAQLGLHAFRRVSDTERQRLTDHPVPQLIARPNPLTTRYRLIDALIHDLGIYDNAYWLKVQSRSGDRRLNLLRIPPTNIAPFGPSWLRPDGYRITGNRGKMTVPVEAVVHFRGYNPTSTRVGLSPMETMRRVIAEEQAAGSYREAMWRNGARMEHVITRPANVPPLSPEAKERFWLRWNAQYTGTPNSARTALLEEGMDIRPMSATARDAQYIEGRRFNLEEAARFFHVPLPMIGILTNANYSNMLEAHKQLYTDTLGPTLTMIQDDFALQVLPDLPDTADVYVEFNIAEKLKGSFEEQAMQLQASVGAPWISRNEARARQNLPPVPAGDDLVTPLNVLIGGQASPRDTAPPPTPTPGG